MAITIPFSERQAGPYVAAAGQIVFDVPFPVLAAEDLTVWRTRAGVTTTLQLSADYIVVDVGQQSGCKIVLTTGSLAGDIIEIDGTLKPERASNLSGNQPFLSEGLNLELNRLTILTQELRRDIKRVSGDVPGAADVTADGNILDNALVRGDGGAKGVQGSLVIVDDNGHLATPGAVQSQGVSLTATVHLFHFFHYR